MIIEPKIRGFICVTAHPTGCAANVQHQIDHVVIKGAIPSDRKRVLVLGCSTGYGLASRIVTTFGSDADTVGVSFEREPGETKPASAGWYNNRAFENRARAAGRRASRGAARRGGGEGRAGGGARRLVHSPVPPRARAGLRSRLDEPHLHGRGARAAGHRGARRRRVAGAHRREGADGARRLRRHRRAVVWHRRRAEGVRALFFG